MINHILITSSFDGTNILVDMWLNILGRYLDEEGCIEMHYNRFLFIRMTHTVTQLKKAMDGALWLVR